MVGQGETIAVDIRRDNLRLSLDQEERVHSSCIETQTEVVGANVLPRSNFADRSPWPGTTSAAPRSSQIRLDATPRRIFSQKADGKWKRAATQRWLPLAERLVFSCPRSSCPPPGKSGGRSARPTSSDGLGHHSSRSGRHQASIKCCLALLRRMGERAEPSVPHSNSPPCKTTKNQSTRDKRTEELKNRRRL